MISVINWLSYSQVSNSFDPAFAFGSPGSILPVLFGLIHSICWWPTSN